MSHYRIRQGEALERLRQIASESVQCCVTSPPYWGLRDYGTGVWEGGSSNCIHSSSGQVQDTKAPGAITSGIRPGADCFVCRSCGAKRIDNQLGLERNPQEYVDKIVAIFAEVKRVLRPDGTLWLNLGDSYVTSPTGSLSQKSSRMSGGRATQVEAAKRPSKIFDSLPAKNLVGIPWRVALALQADGWYLRQDIVWSKVNPQPESVRDRLTKAHEYVFLLTKSPKYYFDSDAVQEPAVDGGTRNKRSVWTLPSQPYRGAHFAVFPEKLVETPILAGSKPKDIVLDPFCGTGTVGVVALHYKRNFLGIELNPETIQLAHARIAAGPKKL